MDGRHFIDYNNGKLRNQEAFCLHLKNSGNFGVIEDDQSNPMTIRILLAKEAMDNISKYVREQKYFLDIARNTTYPFKSYNVQLDSNEAASGSTQFFVTVQNTDPDYTQQTMINCENHSYYNYRNHNYALSDSEFNLFIVQRYSFQFFTNFGSALDRIAFEIKTLYNENGIEYYSNLTNPLHNSVANLTRRGFIDIVNLTTGTISNDIKDGLKYRHRYLHDGILKLLVDSFTGDIKIPDNPRDNNSPFSYNIDDYCEDKFEKLIDLLNQIYGQMIIDI